jgi:hypothetical protein
MIFGWPSGVVYSCISLPAYATDLGGTGRIWTNEHKTNFDIILACWAPGCLFALGTNNTYGHVKLVFAALIMISSTYFVYLSKKYNQSNLAQASNSSNQTSQKRIVV